MSAQPNILFIFTDQHRLSAVGCYGDTPCKTPNIDRLAAQGVRFETAYTVCPVCSPARGTIMTGLYPHSHGICSNVHNLGSSVHELTDNPDLLSRRLENLGYQCGYSGKWHLGHGSENVFGTDCTPSLPKDVGFTGQNFPGHGGGGFLYPEYQDYLKKHGFEHKVIEPEDRERVMLYGLLDGPEESTVPYFLTENTIGLMDEFQKSGEPFFIWHNFWGPHSPYYCPEEFYEIYRNIEIPEWENYRWESRKINRPHQVKIHPSAENLTWEDWAEGIRYYYAFATLIDRQIGRMLDHLEETGLAENTIVIFSSDHGETLGSHGGLTDKGWHHFEEIQRIPFIIRTPEKYNLKGVVPGAVRNEWLSLADVYPTVLEFAGDDGTGRPNHGCSIVPLLRGEPVEWRNKVFVEFYGVNGLATSMVSVRAGNLKYGWNCSNRDELYDLDKDPFEMNNLIDDPAYADDVEKLRKDIHVWMQETRFQGRAMYQQCRLGNYKEK